MQDYLIKSASSDISFCDSDCQNRACDRNKRSQLYKRCMREFMWMSDFSKVCTSYRTPMQEKDIHKEC